MSLITETEFAIHPNTRVLSLILCLAVLLWVFYLVRGKKLKEEYSLLWLLAAASIFLLSLFPSLLYLLMGMVGAKSFGSTLIFCGLGFTILVILHYAVKISRLEDDRNRMAQRLALLENRLEKLAAGKKT